MSPQHFDFKVVVAGPFAAGKTTLIRAISDDIVGTEAPTSGVEAAVKATTTVGMEYGTLRTSTPDFTAELNVYGVPGQRRFEFMWDIVGIGMDGLFLLVDATRPETWTESRAVGEYLQHVRPAPVLVGVNRAVDAPDLLEEVRGVVDLPHAGYCALDVVDRNQVRHAMVELLGMVLDDLGDELEDEFDDADEDFDEFEDHELPSTHSQR
ncbi:MAG: GTP-binding protein [Actinomycetota bacterium]